MCSKVRRRLSALESLCHDQNCTITALCSQACHHVQCINALRLRIESLTCRGVRSALLSSIMVGWRAYTMGRQSVIAMSLDRPRLSDNALHVSGNAQVANTATIWRNIINDDLRGSGSAQVANAATISRNSINDDLRGSDSAQVANTATISRNFMNDDQRGSDSARVANTATIWRNDVDCVQQGFPVDWTALVSAEKAIQTRKVMSFSVAVQVDTLSAKIRSTEIEVSQLLAEREVIIDEVNICHDILEGQSLCPVRRLPNIDLSPPSQETSSCTPATAAIRIVMLEIGVLTSTRALPLI